MDQVGRLHLYLPAVFQLDHHRFGQDILAGSLVLQLEDGRRITVKAADLVHIGPPLDDDSPRKGCGGGGGCSSGGCGVPTLQPHDDE